MKKLIENRAKKSKWIILVLSVEDFYDLLT